MDGKSKMPSCYGWFDQLDPSCRKCSVREACTQHQVNTRPTCFAELYDATHPECMKCLDNSQCNEEMIKMAKPTIRIKRPMAPVAVAEPDEEEQVPVAEEQEPEVDEVPTVEAEPEDVAGTYDDMGINDLRAEAENRGLDKTGTRSALVARLEANDAQPVAPKPAAKVAAKVNVPAPEPKPAAKVATPAPAPKPAATVAPKVAPTPIPQSDGGANSVVNTSVKEVLDALTEGQVLVIARTGKGEWTMTITDVPGGAVVSGGSKKGTVAPVSTGPKLRGQDYWKEVLSPEYYSWYYEDAGTGKPWGDMTIEEKAALANQLGVDPQTYAHADERVSQMRMVEAVQAAMGLNKWKPEYEKKAARDALKA